MTSNLFYNFNELLVIILVNRKFGEINYKIHFMNLLSNILAFFYLMPYMLVKCCTMNAYASYSNFFTLTMPKLLNK